MHEPVVWAPLPSLWQYATHFLFIHTLFKDTWSGIQGAFWSLGLEAQFYVAFPFVVFAYRKFGILVAGGMIAISIVYRIIVGLVTLNSPGTDQFLPSIFFLGRWMEFAAGMISAWVVAKQVLAGSRYSAAYGLVGIVGALVLYVLAAYPVPGLWRIVPSRELLLAASFGLLTTALCASQTKIRLLFENRPVVWLGTISYSVYLIHQEAVYRISDHVRFSMHISNVDRMGLLLTLGFAVVVCLSFAFYTCFEKPFLNKRTEPVAREADIL
jgi:peptidoglycan/LPS O-acetylase OafA/YrhL